MVQTSLAGALSSATHEVQEARRALARASNVTWSSTAADRYRSALDEATAQIDRVARLLEGAAVPVAATTTWRPYVWPAP